MEKIYICLFVLGLMISAALANTQELIPFKIKDQFGKEYTNKDFIGQVSIWIGSDKDGSQFNGIWGNAIKEALQDVPGAEQVRWVGLSDLRGVPFFLKGFVRGRFPKEKGSWVLMDWKGLLPKRYNFQGGASNILVFSPEGKLVHQTAGQKLDKTKLDEIIDRIKGLI